MRVPYLTRNKGLILMLICLIALTGCTTVAVPFEPDVSNLQFIDDMPVVVVNATDSREKDKIGMIGAAPIALSHGHGANMAKDYMRIHLQSEKINTVVVDNLDFSSNASISEAARRLNAQGVILVDVQRLKVGSIDLLLDEPQYEADILVILYSANGEAIFEHYLHGRHKSRALSAKATGSAIAKAISDAFWTLGEVSTFKKALDSLK